MGWTLLFVSIALSLVLMALLTIQTAHIGQKWETDFKEIFNDQHPVTISSWPWIKPAMWVAGIASIGCCLWGLLLLGDVAVGVAK
jgi:hypothetical protein